MSSPEKPQGQPEATAPLQAEVIAVGSELLRGHGEPGWRSWRSARAGWRPSASRARSLTASRGLAEAVARRSGVAVGGATLLEPVPGSSPPLTLAALGVAVNGRTEAREHGLGGDAASVRIRAATPLLDLVRRALPARVTALD